MKKRKGKIMNQVQDLKASLYRIISNYSEEPVSSEGCESLYVFTVSGFLDSNKHEDLLWWMFLALRREAPVSTRSKTAARYDRKYFIPYSEYVKKTTDPDKFRRIVFVYISRKTSDNEAERIWLEGRAKEGCMILASSAICFSGNDGIERFEKNSFYLPVSSLLYRIIDFNDDRYYDLLHFNNVYMRLLFYGNLGLQRSDYIMNRIYSLAGNTDPLSQFYELIKICEYCIHMQALKALCTDHACTEKQAENYTISRMSLGFLSRSQSIDITYHDPELAGSARKLDMLLTGRNSSPFRQSRITYMNLCELVVRLRNRYLGHGIMSEKVTFQMVRPLTDVMYQIVKTFVESERLQDDDCIVTPEGFDPVPAAVTHQKETYYFCGYYQNDGVWYADYLCFRMGLGLRFSLNNYVNPVRFLEKTSQESEAPAIIPPAFKRETALDRDDQKKLGSAMQKTKYLPLVYDGIGDNTVPDIWGTDHYPEFSVNLRSLYSDTTYGKTNYDEQHRLYLKTEHPMYLVQIDMDFLKKFGWTQEEFGERIFLDTIANGLLLPQSRCVMALVGADPEKVKNPYPWIRNTAVAGFRNEQELDYWRAAYSTGMMYEIIMDMEEKAADSMPENKKPDLILFREYPYRKQRQLYEKLLVDFECGSILQNAYNVYFAGMLKNALDAPNLEFAFISLFDFLDFAVTSVLCWICVKNNLHFEDPSEFRNISVAADAIVFLINEKNCDAGGLNDLSRMRIPVTGKLQSLHQKCTRYLPVQLEGTEIDFLTACRILRYLRNRTKGHGFIQKFNAADLWELTMHYTMAVIRFMNLSSFRMELADGRLAAYYDGDEMLYYLDQFYIIDNGMPCPLTEIKGDTVICQNYFTGEKLKLPVKKQTEKTAGAES